MRERDSCIVSGGFHSLTRINSVLTRTSHAGRMLGARANYADYGTGVGVGINHSHSHTHHRSHSHIDNQQATKFPMSEIGMLGAIAAPTDEVAPLGLVDSCESPLRDTVIGETRTSVSEMGGMRRNVPGMGGLNAAVVRPMLPPDGGTITPVRRTAPTSLSRSGGGQPSTPTSASRTSQRSGRHGDGGGDGVGDGHGYRPEHVRGASRSDGQSRTAFSSGGTGSSSSSLPRGAASRRRVQRPPSTVERDTPWSSKSSVRELPPQATVEFFGNVRGDLSMLTALVNQSEVLSQTADGQYRYSALAPLFTGASFGPVCPVCPVYPVLLCFVQNRCCRLRLF